jgi:hypothetical protein
MLAVRKVVGAMPATEAEAARRLVGRVHLLPDASDSPLPTSRVIEEAVVTSRVVEIDYEDRHGESTRRLVEPMALVGSGREWYLVAEGSAGCGLQRLVQVGDQVVGVLEPDGDAHQPLGDPEVRPLARRHQRRDRGGM